MEQFQDDEEVEMMIKSADVDGDGQLDINGQFLSTFYMYLTFALTCPFFSLTI